MMKLNVNHKIRFDRGRVYYSYLQSPITALLVYIFSQGNMLNSVISALATIVMIYIFGFFDDKFRIINLEQQIYSEKNKILMEILDKLNKLEEKYERNN